MSASIFISYRREDAVADAQLLANVISQHLGDGSVFLDTDSIELGSAWPDRISTALAQATTVLVVIGPKWLQAGMDQWGCRRIDDPNDWVLREISEALIAKKVLIPVLVQNASIPPEHVLPKRISALSKLQKLDIRPDYWNHDIKLLLTSFIGAPSQQVIRDSRSLLIDIGSCRDPNSAIPVAEVRFSLTNPGAEVLKVVAIQLVVLSRQPLLKTLLPVPAGPVDEYFLWARVDEQTQSTDLLEQHHILHPKETDGFFLKIHGSEGWQFEFGIEVTWKVLGGDANQTRSKEFHISFPARSPEALLRIAEQIDKGGLT